MKRFWPFLLLLLAPLVAIGGASFQGLEKTLTGLVARFTTGDVTLPNYYEEGTFVAALTGPRSVSVTFRFTRNGKVVCMTWDRQTTGSCTASHFSAAAAVPARLRPGNNLLQVIGSFDNGTTPTNPGAFQLQTSGQIDISKDVPGNNYTNGAACGFYEGSMCYSTN